MASSNPAPDSLVSRVQDFLSENRRAVLIGAAAVTLAVGTAGFLAYTSGNEGEASDIEKGDKRKKKKKTKSKKEKTIDDAEGPIIEERKETKVESDVEADGPKLTQGEIEALPLEERVARASTAKVKGNSAYQKRNFTAAVDFYSEAISISPKPEAVYYSNRAACYVNFIPPRHDLVISDCDKALELDPMYVKALNRRATALEALERYEESLRDFTASTILDKFQNETSSAALERVLKKIASSKAAELMKTRPPRLPSHSFVSAYLSAFRPRPLPKLAEQPSTGDNTLVLAFEALAASDYTHAFSLVQEALEQGITSEENKGEALNLRGTFKFLTGNSIGAKQDFEDSLAACPSLTQTWVKIASVHMEMGDAQSAFAAFESAISHNPSDPDIYYHRGQVYFILQDFHSAEEDYSKSAALDDTFVFSHIQLAVAQYKNGQIANSMATFRSTMKAFPNRGEPQNYYGELLLDQQRYQDAVDKFDAALELDREKQPVNVLPLVNKALTLFQWKNDTEAAEQLCTEALSIDPECDAAIATIAQLALQQGRLDDAIEMFTKHAEIARTEAELEQTLTFKYATQSQKVFLENYPHMAGQLGALARAMQ